MQPDRGMMWQAENPELAREVPAGTASKARQSRLHQAQGVFPVFVFQYFVNFQFIESFIICYVVYTAPLTGTCTPVRQP